jgi:hypothetical protein
VILKVGDDEVERDAACSDEQAEVQDGREEQRWWSEREEASVIDRCGARDGRRNRITH